MIVSLVNMDEHILKRTLLETGEHILVASNEAEKAELLPQADVIISTNRITAAEIDAAPRLRMLFILSAGVETLPFETLRARHTIVANARGAHGRQMFEHALGMMLAFSRKIARSVRNQSSCLWESSQPVETLEGKTLLIVGMGRIGSYMAEKAEDFGLNVKGVRRHPNAGDPPYVRGLEQLPELLPQADFVLILTPLTKDTFHFFGKNEFSLMKKTSVFLNLSRGDTVDEEALIDALQRGQIAGAGLDVMHAEPLPPENLLWKMDNVIITPHTAGFMTDYVGEAMKIFAPNYLAYRNHETLVTQVDLDDQY